MLKIKEDAGKFTVSIQDMEASRVTGDDVWHHMKDFETQEEAVAFAANYGQDYDLQLVPDPPEEEPVEDAIADDEPQTQARRSTRSRSS